MIGAGPNREKVLREDAVKKRFHAAGICDCCDSPPTDEDVVSNEIEALQTLLDTLEPFDATTRKRMLEWLVANQAGLPRVGLPVLPDSEWGRYEPREVVEPLPGDTDVDCNVWPGSEPRNEVEP